AAGENADDPACDAFDDPAAGVSPHNGDGSREDHDGWVGHGGACADYGPDTGSGADPARKRRGASMSAIDVLLARQPPNSLAWTGRVIMGLLFCFLVWAAFAKL